MGNVGLLGEVKEGKKVSALDYGALLPSEFPHESKLEKQKTWKVENLVLAAFISLPLLESFSSPLPLSSSQTFP